MWFMTSIVNTLNSVSSWFHEIYLDVYDWVWPFWLTASLFLQLSELFSNLARHFYDFSNWVSTVQTQVAGILSWSTIWSYILNYVPNLLQLRDWFYNWSNELLSVINSWWLATNVTVQSWITAATQGLADLKVSWSNFSTSVLPTLVSLTWLTAWWTARLLDVQNLINTAFTIRESLWAGWNTWRDSVAEFFASPVQYVWERFMDWFLGPEVK